MVGLQSLGHHYYTQSSTQDWFNVATARITNAGSSFLKELPLVKKIYNTKADALLKEYNTFTKTSLAMALYDTPILGDILYAPLPDVVCTIIPTLNNLTGVTFMKYKITFYLFIIFCIF